LGKKYVPQVRNYIKGEEDKIKADFNKELSKHLAVMPA